MNSVFSACFDDENCSFDVEELEGKRIVRKYKAKEKNIWRVIDHVIEYEYKIASNAITVTRSAYTVLYFFKEFVTPCGIKFSWLDGDLSLEMDEDGTWMVRTDNPRIETDQELFGSEDSQLIIPVEDFETEKRSEVKVIETMRWVNVCGDF
jgi:hypothetical protein